jgi:hypothetical protein
MGSSVQTDLNLRREPTPIEVFGSSENKRWSFELLVSQFLALETYEALLWNPAAKEEVREEMTATAGLRMEMEQGEDGDEIDDGGFGKIPHDDHDARWIIFLL